MDGGPCPQGNFLKKQIRFLIQSNIPFGQKCLLHTSGDYMGFTLPFSIPATKIRQANVTRRMGKKADAFFPFTKNLYLDFQQNFFFPLNNSKQFGSALTMNVAKRTRQVYAMDPGQPN